MGITSTKNTKQQNAEAQFKYRRTFNGTIQAKYHGSKKNAKAKGYEHTLTVEFLVYLWNKQGGRCALTGVNLGFIGSGWCAASIDRINPNLGYTPSNVQWTCWRPNEAKSNMTNEDFVAMCYAVASTVELAKKEKCNDYPEKEYTQVSGSGEHLEKDDDIVYST